MGENIQDWFEAFYATSDNGSEHEKYTTFFTPDAKLIMGDKTAVGTSGIWQPDESHNPTLNPIRILTHSQPSASQLPKNYPANMTTEILQLRTGLWTAVSTRKHTFTYYTPAQKPDTFLLEGDVVYGLKNGSVSSMKWVAKAEFEGDGDGRKMRFYQVFLNAGSR